MQENMLRLFHNFPFPSAGRWGKETKVPGHAKKVSKFKCEIKADVAEIRKDTQTYEAAGGHQLKS